MKFEKVSLNQFLKDYAKAKTAGRELTEDEVREATQYYNDIKLPKRSTSGSAGYDFFIPYTQLFSDIENTLIPTGIRFKCDSDKFLMCVPRSGLGFKYGMSLKNTCGVIDSDYYNSDNEGHIMCKVNCDEHFSLEKGKGLMQGIILPYFKVEDDESEVVRNGGFGSTGM